ncbi:hypothetical protein ACHAQH_002634 [Verticillium albo-atrum]
MYNEAITRLDSGAPEAVPRREDPRARHVSRERDEDGQETSGETHSDEEGNGVGGAEDAEEREEGVEDKEDESGRYGVPASCQLVGDI